MSTTWRNKINLKPDYKIILMTTSVNKANYLLKIEFT